MPLFLCGLVTGGFLASVVAASVAMLWLAAVPLLVRRHDAATADADDPASGERRSDVAGPRSRRRSDLPPLPPLPPPGPPPTQQPPPGRAAAGPSPWTVPRPRPRSQTPGRARPRQPGRRVRAHLGVLRVRRRCSRSCWSPCSPPTPTGCSPRCTGRTPTWPTRASPTRRCSRPPGSTAIVCLVWALVSGVFAVLAFQRMRWAAIALVVSAGAVALPAWPALSSRRLLAAAWRARGARRPACCSSRPRSAG